MVAGINIVHDNAGTDTAPANNTVVDSLGPPNIRFRTDDGFDINTTNPIPIVTGQTKKSFCKALYMKCVTTAPSVKIDNVKFYTDGSGFGTGITLQVGTTCPNRTAASASGYKVATGTVGDTGTDLATLYSLTEASAFGYTSGSPLSVTINETGNIIDAIGETTCYLIFQMDVADTASPADLTNETVTWQYDEI